MSNICIKIKKLEFLPFSIEQFRQYVLGEKNLKG